MMRGKLTDSIKKVSIGSLFLVIMISIITIILHICFISKISAEFKSNIPCSDSTRTCVEGRSTKKVEGFDVTKDCWRYEYIKTCRVQSKDDCGNLSRSHKCYYRNPGKVDYSDPEARGGRSGEVTEHCLFHDYYGNCLNMYKQFVCKESADIEVDVKQVKFNPNKKNAPKKLTCLAAGVTVENKRDGKNMASTLSKLETAHKMSEGLEASESDLEKKKPRANIFPGKQFMCEIKVLNALDCCALDGWLTSMFDIRCGSECAQLSKLRKASQCVKVDEENETALLSFGKQKKYFICYESKLARIVQEGVRRQLGKSWRRGSGYYDASGLSMEDINKADFDKIDLGEYFAEVNALFKSKIDQDPNKFSHSNTMSKSKAGASNIKARSTPKKGGFDKDKYGADGKYQSTNSARNLRDKVR